MKSLLLLNIHWVEIIPYWVTCLVIVFLLLTFDYIATEFLQQIVIKIHIIFLNALVSSSNFLILNYDVNLNGLSSPEIKALYVNSYLTECPYMRETKKPQYLRFLCNLGGLTNSWVGFTTQNILGPGVTYVGGAAPPNFEFTR